MGPVPRRPSQIRFLSSIIKEGGAVVPLGSDFANAVPVTSL